MEANTSRGRLRELHGSGYEVADGQPNIIGWRIRDINNRKIGVVDDLLFDEEQQKVRYILANLKDNHFDIDKRRVLIPIGIAELHETDDDVIVPSVAAWQLRALPHYTGSVKDMDEHEVYSVFSMPAASQSTTPAVNWQKPQNFYESPSFNQHNMYRNRKAGEMKDKPLENPFRKRADADSFADATRGDTEYGSATRSLQDNNAIAASNRSGSDVGNDNLINKIRKVQAELEELERELRSNRNS